jgi:hypothetical protein
MNLVQVMESLPPQVYIRRGELVIVCGVRRGVYTTGEMITSETPALDVLGRYYVAERAGGKVGLYERGKGLQASVSLGTHTGQRCSTRIGQRVVSGIASSVR